MRLVPTPSCLVESPRTSLFGAAQPVNRYILDCICNGGFRPFSRFASGHLPYSVDLLRPALCLPLRISLRNLVYEVTSTSDGCLIFFEGTRRRRGCAEAGGWGRGNILLAELQIHSIADDMVVVESKIKSDRILPRQRLYTSFGSSRVCGVLAGLQTKSMYLFVLPRSRRVTLRERYRGELYPRMCPDIDSTNHGLPFPSETLFLPATASPASWATALRTKFARLAAVFPDLWTYPLLTSRRERCRPQLARISASSLTCASCISPSYPVRLYQHHKRML